MYNSLFHLSYCQGTSPSIMFWTQQTEQRHLRPSVTPSDVEWHPQAPHLKPGEEHKETMGRVEVSVVTHVVILSHPESSWVILYGMSLFPFDSMDVLVLSPLADIWNQPNTYNPYSLINCAKASSGGICSKCLRILWTRSNQNAWVVAKTGCPLAQIWLWLRVTTGALSKHFHGQGNLLFTNVLDSRCNLTV